MPVALISLVATIAAEAAATVVVEIQRYDSRQVRQIDFESLSASRTAASTEFIANCVKASAQSSPTLRPVNSPAAASVIRPKRKRPTQTAAKVEQPMSPALKKTVSQVFVMRLEEMSASTTASKMA